MKVISPSKRKESFPRSLMNDGGKMSILEGTKVNRMLNLYVTIMKGSVKVSTSLIIVETLH